MKLKLMPIMLIAFLVGCGNSADKYSDRQAAYNRSSECYQAREESKDCKMAYESLIGIERSSIKGGSVDEYKEKYCSGLSKDQLLCEVGKVISSVVEQEENDRAKARIEYYLSNRPELQKTYNECGRSYYEKAGLERDGTWIGASGSSKLHKAKKTFSEDFNWDCKAAADAANRLDIEFAGYFVKTL